jgi:hypothetical protein
MLIVLALVAGAAAGLGLHYALPGRALRATALAPMFAAALAGAIWTALTWAGLAEDNPWIWAASLLLPPAVTAAVLALLTRARTAHDARERERLGIL